MKKLLNLQQKVIPELLEVLDVRYTILKNIKYREPIGRRSLSTIVNLSERVVRSETNFLKMQGLIDIKSSGMYITEKGEEICNELKAFMKEISGLDSMEEKLKELLKAKGVIVISGNVAEDSTLYTELGKAAANYLKSIIIDNIIISLTGGHTVKGVVDNFTPMTQFRNIKILPGRGGMGKETEIQSNTLVENLANKLEATYELLHIPDNISSDSFKALIKESNIKDTFESIGKSDILIHGIGLAKEMCDKRSLCSDVKERILESGAIGEAYGHYFNNKGEIVYSMPSIGITKDRIKRIPNVIAIAAGVEKAEAIIAIQRGKENSTLVTDEATAKEILKLFSK